MKKNIIFTFLLLPVFGFSEGNPWDTSPDIEPPPTPIDDNIVFLVLLAVVFAGFLFYKKTIKLEN